MIHSSTPMPHVRRDPITVEHISTDTIDGNHRHRIVCSAGRRTFHAFVVIGPDCAPFTAIDGTTPAVGWDRASLKRAVMAAVTRDLPGLIDAATFRGRPA